MRPDEMTLDEFSDLVERALGALPDWVKSAVEGIAILVDDQPPEDWHGPGLLLGRFHGVARTRRGGRVPGSLPDRIELYREPILRVCRDPEAVADRVRTVLAHEIGHALGIDEQELRALGCF